MTVPNRHPGTTQLLGFFAFEHLPPFLQAVSAPCHDLAYDMVTTLPDGPELTAGLRKLLEAKDCFVRQALVENRKANLDSMHPVERSMNPELQQRVEQDTAVTAQ